MPFKANQDRRHHIPKQRHRVTNWAAYDIALRQRGSLTVWFTEAAIAAWKAEPRATRGGQPRYSALAITTALTLRAVFRLALRQTEGLIASLLRLLGLDLAVPDHSTISRQGETLPVSRPRPGCEPVHLLVDSTGLKLCGPGEWLVEKHAAKVAPVLEKAPYRGGRRHGTDYCRRADQQGCRRLAGRSLAGADCGPGCVVYRRWGVRSGRCLQCGLPTSSGCGGHCAATFERGAERNGRDRADQARPASAADRRARSDGLAAGIWLQLACPGGGRYRSLQASDR